MHGVVPSVLWTGAAQQPIQQPFHFSPRSLTHPRTAPNATPTPTAFHCRVNQPATHGHISAGSPDSISLLEAEHTLALLNEYMVQVAAPKAVPAGFQVN